MKLSAPPPPPPPSDGPPGENAPGSPDERPDETPEAASAAPADAAGPKLVTWPAWFSGVDAALVGLVLLFAFATASFVARNSDLWVHLATGKRLFAGEYFPGGGDPFSYSAEGRAWVNHSWLADATAYLFYGGTGKTLGVAKALLVALTFGVLIAIRRPNFALWPWAAAACVGVLAAAPQFVLRPLLVSMLLLAVTLYLLFRMPQKQDSWRFPGAIAVTFWVWANCDQWFFVGPLALALLLLGDLIQKYGFNSPDEPAGDPDAEPLGRLPDTATLAKGLGIGLLACTLTPHHVRVWELPFELTGAAGAEADPRLRSVLLSPTDGLYVNNAGLGYNANGLAYVALFVAGAAVIGFGVGRVRIAHIALALGFAVLSLLSIYAVPFFALVAVPLVASQLNAFSARAELKTWGDPRTKLLVIGSSAGRVLSVGAVCALCVLAYPGWVHPDTPNPVFARRVAWGVEPDPALVQAAEQFKQWRDSGALPAGARGVVTNTDLANHLAWYAPGEKVFVNARFRHHRRELADYVAVRRGLGLFVVGAEPPNPKDAEAVLKALGAEYVTVGATAGESQSQRFAAQFATLSMAQRWGEWSAWYTDGRTAVFGWRATPDGGAPAFAALRLDPGVLAFGPGAKKVPGPEPKQALAPAETGLEQVVEAFTRPPRPAPPGAAEAQAWLGYKQALATRQQIRAELSQVFFFYAPAAPPAAHSVATLGAAMTQALRFPPAHPESESDAAAQQALPLLALRAARRAIAEDQDHPDAYYALAQVLRDPDLPLTESERALGRVTALRQCLMRLPPPDQYKRGQFAASGAQVARELADAYLGQRLALRDPTTKKEVAFHSGFPIDLPGVWELLGQTILATRQGIERVPTAAVRGRPLSSDVQPFANGGPHFLPIDLAREALQLALRYAPVDTFGDGNDAARVEELKGKLEDVEKELIRYKGRYDAAKGPSAKLPALVDGALRNGMAGEALRLLTEAASDTLQKEYGKAVLLSVVQRAVIELATGRIEDADTNLKFLSEPDQAGAVAALPVGQLKFQKALLAGEYKVAGELIAAQEGKGMGLDPLLAEIAKAGIDPNKHLLAELGRMPPPIPGAGIAPPFLAFRFLLERYQVTRAVREEIANKMLVDSNIFYQRGRLALLEGDNAAAKDWFRQSHREPPPGWHLRPIGHGLADRYLQLIERAERKAPR